MSSQNSKDWKSAPRTLVIGVNWIGDTIMPYKGIIMSHSHSFHNRVRDFRQRHGWSQAQLAEATGISRTAVSAIEGFRLTPSVATAISLATVLGCTVEQLFRMAEVIEGVEGWAFPPPNLPWRYWQAEVGGRVRVYPVERVGAENFIHDGVCGALTDALSANSIASETLVMATCDPAASLLAQEYQQKTGLRLLVINRSSKQALELLRQGLVHVAGVHFATSDERDANQEAVREVLGAGYGLVRITEWEEGIAFGVGTTAKSVKSLIKPQVRWVGREAGSGARKCLDKLLPHRHQFHTMSSDHRGVVEAIRSGWADAGVCVRLVCEEGGLRFLTVQQEKLDLCFHQSFENERRIRSLISTIRSNGFRKQIGELPGYNSVEAGEISFV